MKTIDPTRKGPIPLFSVDYSSLTGGNVGTSPSAAVTVLRYDSNNLLFDALPGDAVFDYANTPQVIVTVNNIPSYCASNCEYIVDNSVVYNLTAFS